MSNNNNKRLRCEELGYTSCDMVPKFEIMETVISLEHCKEPYTSKDVIIADDFNKYVKYINYHAYYECMRCGRKVEVGYRGQPASVNVTFETMLKEKQFLERQEKEEAAFVAQQELALKAFRENKILARQKFLDSLYGKQEAKVRRRIPNEDI